MADEEKIVSLTYVVDPKSQAAIQTVAAMNEKLAQSMKGVASAAEASSQVFVKTTEPLTKQEALLRRVEAGLNPLKKAYDDAANQLLRLQGIMNQEAGNSESRKANIDRARDSYEALTTKVQLLGKAFIDAAGDERFASAEHIKLANAAQILKDRIDPLAAAERAYGVAVKEIDKLLKLEMITQQEHAKALELSKSELTGVHNGQMQVAGSSRVMQYALTNLSFQVNDVVSGLAMGQTGFRIFAQQAGQFVQIFQQAPNVLSQAVVVIKSWITPTTVAVAGVGLLAVGVGSVVREVLAAETRMRSFGIILRTMGTNSLTTSKQLDEVVKKLIDTGSAAADANAAVQAIGRTPGISPARTGDIANTARNISAARGITLQDATTGLSNAIAGGADELTRYAQTIGVKLNPVEQKTIDLAILHRDKIEQLRVAYGAITRTVDGAHKESLTKLQELVVALTNKWNALLRALGETSWFQTAIRGVTELSNILTGLVKGEFKIDIKLNPMFLEIDWNNVIDKIKNKLSKIEQSAIRNKEKLDATPARIPSAPVRSLRQLQDSMDESSTFNYRGFSGPGFSDLGDVGKTKLSVTMSEESINRLVGAIIQIESGGNPNAVSKAGAAGLMQLMPGTAADLGVTNVFDPKQNVNAGTRYIKQLIDKYGDVQTALMAYNWGPGNVDKYLAGQITTIPTETKNYVSKVQGLISGNSNLSFDTGAGGTEITRQTANIRLQETALGKLNLQLVQTQARISATTEAQEKFKESTPENELRKQEFITNAVNLATKQFNDELNKGIVTENLRIKGIENTNKGLMINSEAGIKAAAEAEAHNKVRTTGIDFETAYRQALAATAAEAVKGAAEQTAGQIPVIKGMQDIAAAAKISGQAEHDARVEAEAMTIVQKALDAGQKEYAESLMQTARAQILNKEAAQNSLAITKELNQAKDTQQTLQLQIRLQGQIGEEINHQVVLLQKKQELERSIAGLKPAEKEAIMAATSETQKQVIALNDAQRAWGRIEDVVRSVADTISNTLTRSLEDAFNGNKVRSWGETIRSVLSSILTQIIQFTFIKPAIGTALGALGLNSLSQQFGTFGDLFGNSGDSSNSGSGSSLSSLGGIGKGLFDLFGGSGSSGGGFLSGLFGSSTPALTSAGTFFGDVASATSAGFVFPGAGSTTAAMGAIESGGFLSSIFGSGIGGALSTALPIAGIGLGIAGLLGFNPLDMIFGKSKPSNAAGAAVNLGTGAVNYSQTGGVNDSAAKQFIKSITSFSDQVTKLTGGEIAGGLNPQVYTNQAGKTVYKVGYTDVGGFGTGEFQTQDAQEALNIVKLGIAKSLTGISETMKTIIDSITDPELIQAGIEFAAVYDKLGEEADKSNKKIGPWETSLNEIISKFDELRETAESFGLSLDPVNKALETTKRLLTEDFDKSIQDMILSIQDPVKILIEQEKKAGEARVKDAEAVAGNIEEVNRLNAMTLDAIWKIQTQSLLQLYNDLKSGSGSGLKIIERLRFANDNFNAEVGLIKGGNLGGIDNLVSAGQNVFELSQLAYGNGPQTNLLRNQILNIVDDVMENRSFASGTDSTPVGMIKVHKDEWISNPGGLSVGRLGPNNDKVVDLLEKVARLIQGQIKVTGDGLGENLKALNQVNGNLNSTSPRELKRRRV